MLHYVIGYAVVILASALIATWYVWPAIKDRPPKVALTPLLLYVCLRVNGLMFLMPGLVSPDLPKVFAVPTAYGDLTAASLRSSRSGRFGPSAPWRFRWWLFNIVGMLDLIYANISSLKDHVDPTYLGVSYYLAVLNVPAMLVVHMLIFAYLLRRSPANWTPAQVTRGQ